METNGDVESMYGDARLALDAVRHGQAAAADRLVTPAWYHPALGGLEAMLVLACGAEALWVLPVALVLFSLGVGLLVKVYKTRTGMWISGYSAGRASRWAYCLGGLLAVCLL